MAENPTPTPKAPEARPQGTTALSTKAPHERLFKGTDARVRAFRNNLVRKAQDNLKDIAAMDEKYVSELLAYLDPNELVAAAVAYRDAVFARAKKAGISVAVTTKS